MLIGDFDFPLAEAIIFILLILSLAFNVFLFKRGEGNYSIKYQLMRKHQFFRTNQCLLYTIEYIYKFFFVLPFGLIIAVSVLRAIKDPKELAPLLINGLVILLLLYPTKNQHFNIKNFVMWTLALGSQLSSFFIYLRQTQNAQTDYYLLSIIFYTANIVFFFLSILSIEGCYWEISTAIQKFPEEVKQINQQWVKDSKNIPSVFDGGVYGTFCKNKSYATYLLLYFISLAILGVYAFLVWLYTNSYLGVVGLVSNIIFDIFLQIFNTLESKGRSLTSVYIVLVAGRLLSFVFGSQLWLLGYCLLYFGVGIFIGWMIIDRHLPMKNEKKEEKRKVNALKTPEFVLFILTLEIVIMMISEVYGLREQPSISYNSVAIPIWQWGVIVLIATWVIIVYMLSVRVLLRYKNKIQSTTECYFGFQAVTEYHMYLALSYVLLLALGLYAELYLKDTVILVCCIFLPLIYLCLLAWGVAWQKNQYQLLAQTEDYNKRIKKQNEITLKKFQILSRNTQLQSKKKELMVSKLKQKQGFFDSAMKRVDSFVENHDKTGSQLKMKDETEHTPREEENKEENLEIPQRPLLKDWRDPDQNVSGCLQTWKNLTPSDKKIIISSFILLIFLVGYCVACMLWAKSQFAISFTVCLLSYLLNLSYFRCYKCKCQILIGELIGAWMGFALGVSYWGVYNAEVVGPVVYSFIYIAILSYFIYKAFRHHLELRIRISLGIKILLLMIFILITLGIQRQPIYVAIFAMIFGIILISLIAVYFQAVDDHIPKKIIILVSVLIGSIVISMSVVGFVLNILSGFVIFTIIMAIIWVALLAASIAIGIQKYNRKEEAPSVYSAYGYPHYRFESLKEQLKSSTNHVVIFSFSMVTLIVYAVVISIFFETKSAAVYALAIFIIIDFFIMNFISMSSYYELGKYSSQITDEMILETLNKLKNEYMIDETEGEDSPYYQVQLDKAKAEAEGTSDSKAWKAVVTNHDLLVKNQQEEEKFLFFWIVLIEFNLYSKERQKIITTLNELKEIEDELIENGIFINAINSTLKYHQKYEKVMKELEALQPLDYVIYEEILTAHRSSEKKKKEVMNQLHKKQISKNNERDEELYNQMESVDDPDLQIAKFRKLQKQLGRKTLYTDEDFPANEKSLGELQSRVFSWRRPNVGEMFSKSGISADDVKQGDIGDCYLISSFGVLGEKLIKQAIGFDEKGNERWSNEKGAFMVRFFKFSKQYYVIIDDQMPVNSEDEWVFAKSEDPVEYWPAILEKAYAKLYKGYHNIVQGKCHRVLAQFTGGFPFQILLENYKSNPNGLWTQVINGKNNGYLLAAGSPSHPDGDQAFSKRGIVQGHAYSVLDAQQVDQYKLIKLKNPHGSAGKEWIGDFSDRSDLMTKRMMKMLNHTQAADGIFWMPIQDFIHQFKSLYICSVFDERWIKMGPVDGEWTEQNSFGTPNNAETQKNPQYGITVNKKCTVFISLTQEAKSALKGKYPIYMRVQRNDENRMKQEDISSEKVCGKPSRPIDAVTISAEVELEANSYPYTFTLLVCCREPGSTGKYSLEIYCNDKEAKLIDDKDFDPIER